MSKAPDNERLLELAVVLRGQAPDAWRAFCAALKEYADGHTKNMLGAHPDVLLKAQGMALAVAELSTIMNDAPNLYEQIQIARRKHHVR